MSANQFKRGELYFVITGVPSVALSRRLQKHFRQAGIDLTVEQWSVLVHLWKEDGLSQQALCLRTFRDKPSITRLVDNMEKLGLVNRVVSPNDKRRNHIYITDLAKRLKEPSMALANNTLLEGLTNVSAEDIEVTKKVLTQVYENLNLQPVVVAAQTEVKND